MAPRRELLVPRQATNSVNNSASSGPNIGRHGAPFDNEIPPLNSRLSRRVDDSDDKNSGTEATHVLAKQSHLCYEIQPPSGDLEEEFDNGAAMRNLRQRPDDRQQHLSRSSASIQGNPLDSSHGY